MKSIHVVKRRDKIDERRVEKFYAIFCTSLIKYD